MRKHEMIYVFYNKLPTYNIEDNHIKLHEMTLSNNICNTGVYGYKLLSSGITYEPHLPGSVVKYNVNSKKKHPTEKPQGVLEWLIKYYSKRGDVVLDPTMGSGSTGVACKTLGRTFIGIEMNKEYYDVASAQISPPVVPEEIASPSTV